MNITVGDKIVCKGGDNRPVSKGDVCTVIAVDTVACTYMFTREDGLKKFGAWSYELFPDDFELYEVKDRPISTGDVCTNVAAGGNCEAENCPDEFELKRSDMSDIENARQDVEAAEKQLVEAKLALERAVAEKKNKIGLKIPEMGEVYYKIVEGNLLRQERGYEGNTRYIRSWSSTNQKQNKAFYDALCVMAEMCVQDGIVVPDGESEYCTISFDFNDGKLDIDHWCWTIGISLFPAFESERAAQTAINNVGTERVIQCIKTMMFMTPESRGEV